MTYKFKILSTAVSLFVLMALGAEHFSGLQPVSTAFAQSAKSVKRLPACPENGVIFDNKCYVETGSKPEMGRDPTAAPICWPGYYMRLPYPPFHYCFRQYKKIDDNSPT